MKILYKRTDFGFFKKDEPHEPGLEAGRTFPGEI